MRLSGYYMRLRGRFPGVEDGGELWITVDELAEILDCTHRNVLLILKRMEQSGWVDWKPRRGRGHRSQLVFLLPSGQLVLEMAQDLVEQKDLRGALEQMNVAAIPPSVRERFHEWLYGYFGFSSELKDQKKIDVLRFPMNQTAVTLDPLSINLSAESHLVHQIFDSLVRNNRLQQKIEPHIAHAWEADAERKRWTFYLRKGVLFHHGRELTADDVKFSLERLRDSAVKALYRWAYDNIKSIDAVDPTTVHIELHAPNELFLDVLSTNRASIVPKDAVLESAERFGLQPIGTGPFQLVSNRDSICTLEAFPHYFAGRAHLDRVEIWNLPQLDLTPASNAIHQFQIIHNYRLPEQVAASWNQVQQLGTTCKFITFNTLKQGPLRQHTVSKALSAWIDRREISDLLNEDVVSPSEGFLEPTPLDPMPREEALSVLRSAGIGNLTLCTIPQYEHDARLVRDQLAKAGIELRIVLIEVEEFKGEQRLEADMLLFAVMLDNDLELRLIDLYTSMSEHLDEALKLEMQRGIKLIQREPSAVKREALFAMMENRLKEAQVIHFLYQRRLRTVFHSSVQGLSLDSLGWVRFKDIWFKKASSVK